MRTSLTLLLTGAVLLLSSCSRTDDDAREVVLYSSVDDYVLREVVAAFEASSGIRVRLVGDTEATKTTGLVTRLLAEKGDPKADVWWSSEPFGSIRLAREGVLADAGEQTAGGPFPEGWPRHLRGADNTWFGHALRARAIAFSTDRVADPPTTLAELVDPVWRGRVGIARPEFGTTRGHMAALAEAWGPEAFEAWLTALKANGVRVYDGNSTVVRKIAEGEIDAGLTDTDDVWVARRNGWDVDLIFEHVGEGDPPSTGAMVIPCTAALVAGGPHPAEARELLAFLLSGEAERVLAASDSRNSPVVPGIPQPEGARFPDHPAELDLDVVEARVSEAMAICERVFGG